MAGPLPNNVIAPSPSYAHARYASDPLRASGRVIAYSAHRPWLLWSRFRSRDTQSGPALAVSAETNLPSSTDAFATPPPAVNGTKPSCVKTSHFHKHHHFVTSDPGFESTTTTGTSTEVDGDSAECVEEALQEALQASAGTAAPFSASGYVPHQLSPSELKNVQDGMENVEREAYATTENSAAPSEQTTYSLTPAQTAAVENAIFTDPSILNWCPLCENQALPPLPPIPSSVACPPCPSGFVCGTCAAGDPVDPQATAYITVGACQTCPGHSKAQLHGEHQLVHTQHVAAVTNAQLAAQQNYKIVNVSVHHNRHKHPNTSTVKIITIDPTDQLTGASSSSEGSSTSSSTTSTETSTSEPLDADYDYYVYSMSTTTTPSEHGGKVKHHHHNASVVQGHGHGNASSTGGGVTKEATRIHGSTGNIVDAVGLTDTSMHSGAALVGGNKIMPSDQAGLEASFQHYEQEEMTAPPGGAVLTSEQSLTPSQLAGLRMIIHDQPGALGWCHLCAGEPVPTLPPGLDGAYYCPPCPSGQVCGPCGDSPSSSTARHLHASASASASASTSNVTMYLAMGSCPTCPGLTQSQANANAKLTAVEQQHNHQLHAQSHRTRARADAAKEQGVKGTGSTVVVGKHHHYKNGAAPTVTYVDFYSNVTKDHVVHAKHQHILPDGTVTTTTSSENPSTESPVTSSSTTTTTTHTDRALDTTTSSVVLVGPGAPPTATTVRYATNYSVTCGSTIDVPALLAQISSATGVPSSRINVMTTACIDGVEIVEVTIILPAGSSASTQASVDSVLGGMSNLPTTTGGSTITLAAPVVSVSAVSPTGAQVTTSPTHPATVAVLLPVDSDVSVSSDALATSIANTLGVASSHVTVVEETTLKCVCATGGGTSTAVGEGGGVTVACPLGKITSIAFASYGTPTGTCGNYNVSSCNAASSRAYAQQQCVSTPEETRSSCSFNEGNSVFGDPCPGTPKEFKLEVCCSATTVLVTVALAGSTSGSQLAVVGETIGNITSVPTLNGSTASVNGPSSVVVSPGASETAVTGSFTVPAGTVVDKRGMVKIISDKLQIPSSEVTIDSSTITSSSGLPSETVGIEVLLPGDAPDGVAGSAVGVLSDLATVSTEHGGQAPVETSSAATQCGFVPVGCFAENPALASGTGQRAVPIVLGDTTSPTGSNYPPGEATVSPQYNSAIGNNIAACEAAARAQGYTTVAMQYNSACYACTDCAYAAYGGSTACSPSGLGGAYANNVYVLDATNPYCPGSSSDLATVHVIDTLTVAPGTSVDVTDLISTLSNELSLPSSDISVTVTTTSSSEEVHAIVDVDVSNSSTTNGGLVEAGLGSITSLPTVDGGASAVISSAITTSVTTGDGTAVAATGATPATVTGTFSVTPGTAISATAVQTQISNAVGVSSSDVSVVQASTEHGVETVQVVVTLPTGSHHHHHHKWGKHHKPAVASSVAASLATINSFDTTAGGTADASNPVVASSDGTPGSVTVNFTVPAGTQVDTSSLIATIVGLPSDITSSELTLVTATTEGGRELIGVTVSDVNGAQTTGGVASALAGIQSMPTENGASTDVGLPSHTVTAVYAVTPGSTVDTAALTAQIASATGLSASLVNVSIITSPSGGSVVLVVVSVPGTQSTGTVTNELSHVSQVPSTNGGAPIPVLNAPVSPVVTVIRSPVQKQHKPASSPLPETGKKVQHNHYHTSSKVVPAGVFAGHVTPNQKGQPPSAWTSTTSSSSETLGGSKLSSAPTLFWCSICYQAGPNWVEPTLPAERVSDIPPCPPNNICPSIVRRSQRRSLLSRLGSFLHGGSGEDKDGGVESKYLVSTDSKIPRQVGGATMYLSATACTPCNAAPSSDAA